MAQAATFVLHSERCISSEQSKELINFLEGMRLPEEPNKPEEVTPQVVEKTEGDNSSSPSNRLNDPSIYCAQVPFLIYDENKETIISRTAKGINEGKLNPYEIDWREVTLYETNFVRDLLEVIDSVFIKDVAQAIDDEDKRHAREDGQFTDISSDFYGTGQGSAVFYSYMRDNWQNDSEYVSAVTIAEGILDKRNKAEEYRKKINEKKSNQTPELKKHIVEIIDEPESHLHVKLRESIIDQSAEDEINALKRECEEWKAKHAKLEKTLQARTDELDKWHYMYEEETKRTVMVDSLEEELDRWKKKCEELESKIDPEYEPEDIMIVEDRKIDVIKILHAMCKIGVLQKKNGSKITQNTVMKLFGKMLNDDFSEYSSNLSTSKSKTKEPSYMQVFDELRKAAYDYFKKS